MHRRRKHDTQDGNQLAERLIALLWQAYLNIISSDLVPRMIIITGNVQIESDCIEAEGDVSLTAAHSNNVRNKLTSCGAQ